MRPALRAIAPGHGHLIEDPQARLTEYIDHRLAREAQVVATLDALGGSGTAAEIVERVYVDLVEELVPRARQSVHAHLRKLAADGAVSAPDLDDEATTWKRS
jgi:hypothetical protein